MKKRLLALFAALMMILAGVSTARAGEALEVQDALVVGHTTMMSGNFFSEIWGNNTADLDVRTLLHEYPLVMWSAEGDYQVNRTVVRALETATLANGDKNYTVTLQPDLYFSDGSHITAKDFLFSYLLMASPQIAELSGVAAAREFIEGAQDFQAGEKDVLSGLRLLDEYRYSVRVPAEYLPYYYELNYINTSPLPYRVIVPGSDVVDDGEGVYVTGEYTADVLRDTILNDETGYLSHPTVTSGPYRLKNYDGAKHVAEFEINPYYKGNFEGQVPAITRIIFREVKNESIVAELQAGSVDLVNKASEGKVIDGAFTLAAGGGLSVVPYPRTGAGFLAVAAERNVTSSVQARQALAYCLDYEVLPRDFLNNYGERVYAYYGLGQWMALERADELEKLHAYTLDLQKAQELFVQDGWTLNESGEPFDAADDTLRYRQGAKALEPLRVVLAVTEKNDAADMVAQMLSTSLEQIGGELKVVNMPYDLALRQYYRQEPREFDLMFQGTNFVALFDPSKTYMVGDQYQGTINTSGVQDPQLEKLAMEITTRQPGDRDNYLDRWMAFQRYWAEVLPMIPLYSNTYHDLFTSDLMGYFPQFYPSWGTAILYATLNR